MHLTSINSFHNVQDLKIDFVSDHLYNVDYFLILI